MRTVPTGQSLQVAARDLEQDRHQRPRTKTPEATNTCCPLAKARFVVSLLLSFKGSRFHQSPERSSVVGRSSNRVPIHRIDESSNVALGHVRVSSDLDLAVTLSRTAERELDSFGNPNVLEIGVPERNRHLVTRLNVRAGDPIHELGGVGRDFVAVVVPVLLRVTGPRLVVLVTSTKADSPGVCVSAIRLRTPDRDLRDELTDGFHAREHDLTASDPADAVVLVGDLYPCFALNPSIEDGGRTPDGSREAHGRRLLNPVQQKGPFL